MQTIGSFDSKLKYLNGQQERFGNQFGQMINQLEENERDYRGQIDADFREIDQAFRNERAGTQQKLEEQNEYIRAFHKDVQDERESQQSRMD